MGICAGKTIEQLERILKGPSAEPAARQDKQQEAPKQQQQQQQQPPQQVSVLQHMQCSYVTILVSGRAPLLQ